jgi:hypothetical protein
MRVRGGRGPNGHASAVDYCAVECADRPHRLVFRGHRDERVTLCSLRLTIEGYVDVERSKAMPRKESLTTLRLTDQEVALIRRHAETLAHIVVDMYQEGCRISE